jgi:hypothetical protein
LAILDNINETPSKMLFHPFDQLLVIADEQEAISVWNWEARVRMNSFSNRSPSERPVRTSFYCCTSFIHSLAHSLADSLCSAD